MLMNPLRGNKKKQTAELAEYFESVSSVSIKDLCTKEEGKITYTRNTEKADICFTLKAGGAASLESRFEESGYSIIRDPGSLPGLDGYRFSDNLHEEEILGWYTILIYITRDQGGIEHVYVFR